MARTPTPAANAEGPATEAAAPEVAAVTEPAAADPSPPQTTGDESFALVEVRILHDHAGFLCNQVVAMGEAEAAAAVAEGWADGSEGAVAYAKSLLEDA